MSWFDEQDNTTLTREEWQAGNRGTTEPVNQGYQSGNAAPATGGAQPASPGGATMPFSEGALQEILHKYPPTNEGMRAAMQEIDHTFGSGVVSLLEHPTKLDKLRLPGGRVIDTIVGSGGANPSWGWQPEGAGGGGAGGAAGQLGGMLGGNAMAGIDPSYEFRFKEGQKALERSAAAKGTLLTGGTLKALANYGQEAASQEFGNIFNRNMGVANLGLTAAGNLAQTGSSYSGQLGQLAGSQANNTTNLLTGAANVRAGQTAGNAGAWGGALNTLGGLAADWVKGRGRGGGGGGGPTLSDNMPGYPNVMNIAGQGVGTFPGWFTDNTQGNT